MGTAYVHWNIMVVLAFSLRAKKQSKLKHARAYNWHKTIVLHVVHLACFVATLLAAR